MIYLIPSFLRKRSRTLGVTAWRVDDSIGGYQILYPSYRRLLVLFQAALIDGWRSRKPEYSQITLTFAGLCRVAITSALLATLYSGPARAQFTCQSTDTGFSANPGDCTAHAFASYNLAIGGGASTAGFGSTAVGQQAVANNSSTALGTSATATALNSVAIGSNSFADIANSVSIGSVGAERTIVNVANGSIATGSTYAATTGQLYTANQRVAAAFGGGSIVDSSGQITTPNYNIQGQSFNNAGSAFTAVNNIITMQNVSGADLATQIGMNTTNLTTNSKNVATNTSNINKLNSQVATNSANIGINTDNIATNSSNIATNTANIATNTAAIDNIYTAGTKYFQSNSTGNAASATGVNSTAIGSSSSASGINSMAFGTSSQATQTGSIAIGTNSASTGTNAIAIGTGAVATGSVAVGFGAQASNGGAAYGDGAVATAPLSTAVGPNSSATAANSVAIGSGSTNTIANTVSVGSVGSERRITNVAGGINQTDAVNVGQLQSVANGFQSQVAGLQSQITDNLFEMRSGVALALAASGLRYDDRPGKLSVAGAFGGYKGASGIALGVGYAATDRLRFNASISGSPSQGSYGGVVGGSITLN